MCFDLYTRWFLVQIVLFVHIYPKKSKLIQSVTKQQELGQCFDSVQVKC